MKHVFLNDAPHQQSPPQLSPLLIIAGNVVARSNFGSNGEPPSQWQFIKSEQELIDDAIEAAERDTQSSCSDPAPPTSRLRSRSRASSVSDSAKRTRASTLSIRYLEPRNVAIGSVEYYSNSTFQNGPSSVRDLAAWPERQLHRIENPPDGPRMRSRIESAYSIGFALHSDFSGELGPRPRILADGLASESCIHGYRGNLCMRCAPRSE